MNAIWVIMNNMNLTLSLKTRGHFFLYRQGRQSGLKRGGAQRGRAGNFGVYLAPKYELCKLCPELSGRGRKSGGARALLALPRMAPLPMWLFVSCCACAFPGQLNFLPIMYFVIHNSVVLSKILKIVVPFWPCLSMSKGAKLGSARSARALPLFLPRPESSGRNLRSSGPKSTIVLPVLGRLQVFFYKSECRFQIPLKFPSFWYIILFSGSNNDDFRKTQMSEISVIY